jgi:membrane protein
MPTEKSSIWKRAWTGCRGLWDESALCSQTELGRLQKSVHFCLMVCRSFSKNRCPARASALAYATLLALIPMLAVVVGVTSSFLKREGEDRIDEYIAKMVDSVMPRATYGNNDPATPTETPDDATAVNVAAGTNAVPSTNAVSSVLSRLLPSIAQQEKAVEARKDISRQIHEFIKNTRSGALGVTGSVLLIFVGISMLSRIEDTFNDIWGVARGRSWFTRVMLYWGVITLAPLLLVVAGGLASGSLLKETHGLLRGIPFFGTLGFQLLPVLVLCLTFAILYVLIPNTRVHWQAALAGGFVGGVLFHANNMISVLYVSRVVSNSRIYGSLGLVPVFMIGLYLAWLILLFGAQVAYACQNRASYVEEKQIENINQRGREFIALRLMTSIGQRFLNGLPAPAVVELGTELAIPTRLVQQITRTLSLGRLLVETAGAESAFLPARPLEQITCHDILLAMRTARGQELATREEPARLEVFGEFQRIAEAERQAASSVTLLALAGRAGMRHELTDGSEGMPAAATPSIQSQN